MEAYDVNYLFIPKPDDPVQVLEYYMGTCGLNRADLIPIFFGRNWQISRSSIAKAGFHLRWFIICIMGWKFRLT